MLFWKDEETGKTKKVTAKDLQDNIMKIRTTMNWVEDERAQIVEEIKKIDMETRINVDTYIDLRGQLRELSDQITSLRRQEAKQRTEADAEQIRISMDQIWKEREQVLAEMNMMDVGIRPDAQKYLSLKGQLKELNEQLGTLQDQEEKQYAILKKYKDSKFYIQPKDWLIIGGTTVLAVFIIALDRESPKITKLASFILKLFPMHI